jgi:hypothetical protein
VAHFVALIPRRWIAIFFAVWWTLAASSMFGAGSGPPAGPAPLRDILAHGVAPAPVESGLSFALSINGGGASIRTGPWMLRIPGAPKPLQLDFERPRLEAGFLDALARIRNVSGAFAGGLRLDMLEISEGAPAAEGPGSRAESVGNPRPLALDSPLYFGDLAPGADAAVPVHLGPLNLTPGSPFAVLRGIVTGAAAFGTVEGPDVSDPVALDADGQGVVYVGDGAGRAVFLLGPQASAQKKIPAGCSVTGVAVRRKTRDLFASCRDVTVLLRLAPSGKLMRTDDVGRSLGALRFGGTESLYGSPADTVVRLDGLSIKEEVSRIDGKPFHAAGFDVDNSGTIWAVTAGPEGKLLRIRSQRDVFVAAGAGEGLGAVADPRTCRVGPDGSVYVLQPADRQRPARIDAFDRSGNFLRGWSLPSGTPVDLAFGSEDRLLVLWKHENGRAAVSVYRLF